MPESKGLKNAKLGCVSNSKMQNQPAVIIVTWGRWPLSLGGNVTRVTAWGPAMTPAEGQQKNPEPGGHWGMRYKPLARLEQPERP